VPEEVRDGDDVGALLDETVCEEVAQVVRGEAAADPRPAPPLHDRVVDGLPRHVPVLESAVWVNGNEQRPGLLPSHLQPVDERGEA
jgi:hypothetical protein